MHFEWTVFFGDAGDAEARIYVLAEPKFEAETSQDEAIARLEGLKITGRVEGPKCRYSHTLPARIPVQFRGFKTTDGKPMLVGESIVPDPNMWTPELPFLYRATVEVRRGTEVVASYEQDFGIRPLGVIGKRLVYCGKTWVPRGVRREVVVGDAPLSLWRETATVMVVDDPDEHLCKEASELGVILFARITIPERNLRNKMRMLSRYPAVGVLVLGACVDNLNASDARNAVLVQEFHSASGVDPWANVFLYSIQPGSSNSIVRIAELASKDSVPAIVLRNTTESTLVEARAACDALQADLAGKCHPAGYIV